MYKKVVGINLVILFLAVFCSFTFHLGKNELDIINFFILLLNVLSIIILKKEKTNYSEVLKICIISIVLYLCYFGVNIFLNKLANKVIKKIIYSMNPYLINIPILIFNIIMITLWFLISLFIFERILHLKTLHLKCIIRILLIFYLVLIVINITESHYSQNMIDLKYNIDKACKIANIFSSVNIVIQLSLKSVSLLLINLLNQKSEQ